MDRVQGEALCEIPFTEKWSAPCAVTVRTYILHYDVFRVVFNRDWWMSRIGWCGEVWVLYCVCVRDDIAYTVVKHYDVAVT